jgi:N-acetylglucosaminyldiphosphoundecaprenol N-acetyl-beta-D-mannosaminyltransferase
MNQRFSVIGTPLLATTYDGLQRDLLESRSRREQRTIDFSNTHIVTARRHEADFRAVTEVFDTFVPDGMPLIWCMNAQGAGLKDRVYGPTFTRHFLVQSPREVRHFFLGGSEECLRLLLERMRAENPGLNVAGPATRLFQSSRRRVIIEKITRRARYFMGRFGNTQTTGVDFASSGARWGA